MIKSKSLAKNTISSFLFQITIVISGFILPRLILQNYGSEVNGLVSSITQFLTFVSFLELGMGAVVQSSLYKPLAEEKNDKISEIMVSAQTFFNKVVKILLVYILALIFLYPYITTTNFSFAYTALLIIAMSISSFSQYYFGMTNKLLLNADQKGYISYNIQTITIIINTLTSVILIKANASIHIVKLFTSLIYVVRPIYLKYYVDRNYDIDRHIIFDKEPINQKWHGVAQHIAAVILDSTDLIVLTMFSTLSQVSVYSVYLLVVGGIKQLFLSMTNGIQSILGELWARKNNIKLYSFFDWVEWSIHTATIYIFGITGMLIVPFVTVYTKGITDTNYIQPTFAAIMVVANAFHCLRLPYILIVKAAGHYKETQKSFIVSVIMNVLMSVILVSEFGLIGVVLGTVISMLYQTLWLMSYVSKNIIVWPKSKIIKQLCVDILTIFILKITTFKYTMLEITYISWLFLAIKVGITASIVVIAINYLFYRNKINYLFSKIIKK